ncbi:MAG: ABC transporter permease, partial [Bacteroidales bacterium]
MFKNYLLTALRNLYKNKLFALINILGLGIALAICVVAYFNHMFAADFDMMHSRSHEIYKINSVRDLQGRSQEYGITPMALGPMIAESINGVESLIRISLSRSPVKHGNEVFNRLVAYADPEYFNAFDLPLKTGAYESFRGKGNIMISEKLAGIHFGDSDPVGEIITVFDDNGNPFDYVVGAVFKEIPQNNTIQFDALTVFENFPDMFKIEENDWRNFVAATFLVIPDEGKILTIDAKIDELIPVQNKGNETFTITDFRLLPLKEVANNSRDIWSNWLWPGLHPAHRISPTIMAILILLIACFNFTNTAIAVSSKRLKEISMRKISGGTRGQLILQFWGENLFICLLALLLAIFFAQILIGAYNRLWDYMTLSMDFSGNVRFWIFLVAILFITGIIAGTYPSVYISSFRPMEILRQRVKLGGTSLLSKILLAFQVCISVVSLVGGIVFSRNAYYQDTLDLGYDKENILVVSVNNQSDYEKFRQVLIRNPRIISVAGTYNHVGWGYYRRGVEFQEMKHEVNVMDIGQGYIETVGLDLVEGRSFEEGFEKSDEVGSIIVNEKFVEDFKWDDPVGKRITLQDTITLTVIGTIKDFYLQNFWSPIDPTMLRLVDRDWYYNLAIRSRPEDRDAVFDFLETEWKRLIPNVPFRGIYQEETLEEARYINASIKKIFVFLAITATLLSLIGLYNLISLNIISRTKEIGIRKVMGSGIPNIALRTNRAYIIIVIVSSLLG